MTPEIPPLPPGPLQAEDLIRYLLQFAGLATAWLAKHVWGQLEKTRDKIEQLDKKIAPIELQVDELKRRVNEIKGALDEHHEECDDRHDSTERKLRQARD